MLFERLLGPSYGHLVLLPGLVVHAIIIANEYKNIHNSANDINIGKGFGVHVIYLPNELILFVLCI